MEFLALDVKVWEPSVINLFQSLGNTYANSIWEFLPSVDSLPDDGIPSSSSMSNAKQMQTVTGVKPHCSDPISIKVKFIQAKYVEKLFVQKSSPDQHLVSASQQMWDSVRINDKKAVYRLIVGSDADVNCIHGQTPFSTSLTLAKVMLLHEQPTSTLERSAGCMTDDSTYMLSTRSTLSSSTSTSEEHKEAEECLDGCSLLHVACQTADVGMIELLLQYGANINAIDSKGQTSLHHCILRGRTVFARHDSLPGGAETRAVDREGKPPLQRALEDGTAIIDGDILIMLADVNR